MATVTGIDGVNTHERTKRLRTCLEKVSADLTAEWTTLDRDEVIRVGMEHRAVMIDEFFQPSFAPPKARGGFQSR